MLGILVFPGVLIAYRRRASFREAVIQWCVPPGFLLTLSSMQAVFSPGPVVVAACLGIGLSIGAVLNRFCLWRGDEDVFWPKGRIGDATAWGFVEIAVMIGPTFAFFCCVASLFA